MNRMLFSVLLLVFLSGKSFAEDQCVTAPTNYRSLLACAESRSPDIQSAKLELESAQKQVEAAGQWRNPELSAETFRGKVGGERRSETDIALGVPVELGGKISARVGLAQGSVRFAEAKLFEARARVRAETLLKLHRLRQVLHEREIVDEAVSTFSKLIGRYNQRPGLSPEQQVSSSVFQLSKGDYELKRIQNSDELLALDSYFKLNIGFGIDQVKPVVPESPKKWPSFAPNANPKMSARQQVLQAEVETAKAQYQVAKSESWPTVVVGPSVKMLEESRVSDQLVGFNISLPIPVFNANGSGRAAASAGLKASEARKQFGLREQELVREELRKIYEHSVTTLTTTLSHRDIEKRHEDSEKLFIRGVIPSALVIEAHRTSYDLERTRHERELKALEALMGLYALDGTLMENNL